jgi:hypothetical protein
MKILYAPTEDFIKGQRATLTAGVAAGSAVSIPVDNSAGFNVDDYIVIGAEGSDQAELVQITAIADANHVTATLAQAHSADDPIVFYRYNERKFYGSLTSGGAYTELTAYGSPAAIGVDDPQGTSIEYTGGEGYIYFKSTYWNSTTSTESNIADANEVLADESTRYCSLYQIRKQAGITQNPYYDDGKVEDKRKQAENEVNSYLLNRYVLPLTNSVDAPEVPFLITRCAYMLAAGYIDYEEFGSDGNGVKWLGEARGILNSIQKGTQRLIDSTGAEFTVQEKTQVLRGQEYQPPSHEIWVDGKRF